MSQRKRVKTVILKRVKTSWNDTVETEMVEHWMRGAVAARQPVVGEAGDLEVASLEHNDWTGEQIEVNTSSQQVVEPSKCAHVVQLVLRQVDIAHVQEVSQQINVRQTAAQQGKPPTNTVICIKSAYAERQTERPPNASKHNKWTTKSWRMLRMMSMLTAPHLGQKTELIEHVLITKIIRKTMQIWASYNHSLHINIHDIHYISQSAQLLLKRLWRQSYLVGLFIVFDKFYCWASSTTFQH